MPSDKETEGVVQDNEVASVATGSSREATGGKAAEKLVLNRDAFSKEVSVVALKIPAKRTR